MHDAATDIDIRDALERHHVASYGWALHCCGNNPNEAEEVLQIAYLEVLEGRARFGGRSSFRTWLFGVIRNTAAGRRRRRAVRGALLRRRQEEVPRPQAAVSPERRVDEDRERERLRAALELLPGRQREVLLLTFYHGMSIEAAGVTLGISLGSARTHYHRGKQRLRRVLKPTEAEA